MMGSVAAFRGNFSSLLPLSSQCSSCFNFQLLSPPSSTCSVISRSKKQCRVTDLRLYHNSRIHERRATFCRATEAQDSDNDKEKEEHEVGGTPPTTDSVGQPDPQSTLLDQINSVGGEASAEYANQENEDHEVGSTQPITDSVGKLDSQPDPQPTVLNQIDIVGGEASAEDGNQDESIEVSSGSPLPGVKPQQFDESIRMSKGTIDILKDQVFGFDTFFVTSQEPYEGGVLFKGNLRGKAAKSYEKISTRMQNKFGDEYKLFLLVNPEDDKPVAVVVPRKTLQPETTAVPEWFAAGAFGLVTVFTLLLRNVPALQANLLSTFDNLELLKNGLPGALVTALILGVHEVTHIIVAKRYNVKLGVPYFVPSWQIGSFGAITRIVNIVPNREVLLKVAAAGPLAGFSLGLVLFLAGLILPPNDGVGLIVDASVFHESFLAGGIAKLILGDALKEGTPISVNPLVLWAWAGLLINAINSIPAGEIDGGRISFSLFGRKVSSRLTGFSIALLGVSSLFNDVAFYWVVLIFFLQRGPIAPLSEEITDPDDSYVALGVLVLLLGLLVCLPYPFPFVDDAFSIF